MNIVHFSTHDKRGAGEAAYRFHKNLQEHGHQSLMLVQKKLSDDDSIVEVNDKILDFVYTSLRTLDNKLNCFDDEYLFFNRDRDVITNYKKLVSEIPFKPDAIVLNWISGFVNIKVIKDLQDYYNVPVFWHFMDMAPLTGGCHYAWDCEGYKNSCENCPAILNEHKKELSKKILKNKEEIISKMKLYALMGSGWTMKQTQSSTIFKNTKIYPFAVSVDENIFKPLSKIDLRKKYKIPLDKRVIYFAASNISDKRKGYDYLIEALKRLSNHKEMSNVIVVIAGNSEQTDILLKDLVIDYINIGYLNGNSALAEGYNLADVYLSPSIQDSGPMMVNESLMCGVPVIAFEMGVAVGLIKNGVHGYMAKLKDSNEFGECILKFLEHNEEKTKEMSKECRKLALETNSFEKQMKNFQNMLEETKL